MTLIVLLLLIFDPILGLECLQSKCFLDKAEAWRCYPPYLQSTTVDCPQASHCGLRRKITSFSSEEINVVENIEGSGSDAVLGFLGENSITYDRDCVNDNGDCNGEWNCVTDSGTLSCHEALCCSSSFCNRDANFSSQLDDTLLARFSNGNLMYVSTTTSSNNNTSSGSARPADKNAAVLMSHSMITLVACVCSLVMLLHT